MNSCATCLFSAVAATLIPAAQANAAAQPLDVMPAPAEARVSEGRVGVSGTLLAAGASGPRLDAAIARAAARWRARIGGGAAGEAPVRLTIECAAAAGGTPTPADDESYALDVEPSRVVLRAATDTGALRGLETLLQLPARVDAGWSLPLVSIRDAPRFPWRGLLIDVSRHWEPPEVIERNLGAMAAVKLNVLHLHLTDDQGFRIESLTHPELQAMGSDGLYFTQAQMRAIIAHAADRGIRVVPEFDMPGHATSWAVSHPELASMPGPYAIQRRWGVFNPVLDPTNEATYALLGDFLGEMSALFPDPFIHIGGDENNGVQWNANPRIQAFIREHGLKGNPGLHAYFNRRIAAVLARHGKRLVGWDEILSPELPRDCVVHTWRGTGGVADAAALGFDDILSGGYYIDLMLPASEHYLVDPLPESSALTPSQRAHVLGGEATMWGEWVTPETIDSRIWPRAAAIAERLWSPAGIRDVPDMYRRLAAASARLDEAGALHERNAAVMLRHLVGADLGAPGVSSLRTLIGLLEPVRGYRRGELQPWGNQLVPLIYLADAARADSAPSMEFAARVERTLFAPGAIDRPAAASLAATLDAWGADGREVAEKLAPSLELWEPVAPARALAGACAVGAEAARSLASGTPASDTALASGLEALDRAAEPNGSATELPVLAPIRLLAAAAARQGGRAGLSGEAWRALVVSTALPRPPAGATR